MKNLILVPHQDDEMIGCYSIMKQYGSQCKVAIVIKGGGEPKGYTLDPDELYQRRCGETVEACSRLGVIDFAFLGVPQPANPLALKLAVKEFLAGETFDRLFSIFPFDNHPEHNLLGHTLTLLGYKFYGFIVQTNYLYEMRKQYMPHIVTELEKEEYIEKVNLIDCYRTQKHFLPNVIRRQAYQYETFWEVKNGG